MSFDDALGSALREIADLQDDAVADADVCDIPGIFRAIHNMRPGNHEIEGVRFRKTWRNRQHNETEIQNRATHRHTTLANRQTPTD